MQNKYSVQTKAHYKIWFSKSPDSFLPLENQLRFIRMRQKNPSRKLSFIYSANCLSNSALKALIPFCKTYDIQPIDFDSEVDTQTSPLKDQDKSIFQIAQDEIAHCRNQTGGSMAAASDCARLIVPLI